MAPLVFWRAIAASTDSSSRERPLARHARAAPADSGEVEVAEAWFPLPRPRFRLRKYSTREVPFADAIAVKDLILLREIK